MTWLHNKWHEVDITAWNETDITELDGGLVERAPEDNTTLRVFIVKTGSMFFYDNEGRFYHDGIQFQVSLKELTDKDFTIQTGNTHVEINGNIYRIVEVTDYTAYVFTQLIECRGVKLIGTD